MKIHSLSKALSLPLILMAGYIFLFKFNQSDNSSFWIFAPVIMLTLLYVFHGVIDHWWQEKYPIELDQKLIAWLNKYSTYYNDLDELQKKEYQKRMSLYLNAREFKAVGTKENRDVPYDIRAALASQGIKIGFGLEDYLLGDLDRVYVYKHPFPSPNFKFLHTVETNHEDGMLILSLPNAIEGIVNPEKHYNIALHGYADAFVNANRHLNFPEVSQYGWETIEEILDIKKESILKTTGFDTLPMLPIHIVAFFQKCQKYESHFPNEHKELSRIFNQNP